VTDPRASVLRATGRDVRDALIGLLLTGAALLVAAWLLAGLVISPWWTAFLVAAVLAGADALARPVLRALAGRLGAVAALVLGVVVQVALVELALLVVPNVTVASLGTTVATLVIVALVAAVTRWLVGVNDSSTWWRTSCGGDGPNAGGRARSRTATGPHRRRRGAARRPAVPAAALRRRLRRAAHAGPLGALHPRRPHRRGARVRGARRLPRRPGRVADQAVLMHPADWPLDADLLDRTVAGEALLCGPDAVHRQLVRWLERCGARRIRAPHTSTARIDEVEPT